MVHKPDRQQPSRDDYDQTGYQTPSKNISYKLSLAVTHLKYLSNLLRLITVKVRVRFRFRFRVRVRGRGRGRGRFQVRGIFVKLFLPKVTTLTLKSTHPIVSLTWKGGGA